MIPVRCKARCCIRCSMIHRGWRCLSVRKRYGCTASHWPGFGLRCSVIDDRLRAVTSSAASTRCSADCRRRGA